jgi:hypothetical protein
LRRQAAPIAELSSSAPASIVRENRIDRTPRRHSHQKTPAWVAEARVSRVSRPRFTTVPTAPRPLLNRTMKKITFQNSATLVWRNARSSSSFSLPDEGR